MKITIKLVIVSTTLLGASCMRDTTEPDSHAGTDRHITEVSVGAIDGENIFYFVQDRLIQGDWAAVYNLTSESYRRVRTLNDVVHEIKKNSLTVTDVSIRGAYSYPEGGYSIVEFKYSTDQLKNAVGLKVLFFSLDKVTGKWKIDNFPLPLCDNIEFGMEPYGISRGIYAGSGLLP